MQEKWRRWLADKKAVTSFSLVILSVLVSCMALSKARLTVDLLAQSYPQWQTDVFTQSDQDSGFDSVVAMQESAGTIDFTFRLGDKAPFSFARLVMLFKSVKSEGHGADLSQFSKLTIYLHCPAEESLHFFIEVSDPQFVSSRDNHLNPNLERQFQCLPSTERVEMAFSTLETPVWWLKYHDLEFAKTQYTFDDVIALGIGTTRHTQKDSMSEVHIEQILLHGWNNQAVYVAFGAMVFGLLILVAYFASLVRIRKTDALPDSLSGEGGPAPMLPVESKTDFEAKTEKEAKALLDFMAEQYSNPDMCMELVIAKVGINRNKINDILKQRCSLTFSAYLNQLRLQEAARILAANQNSGVSEVAYAVGYNNASYFSKLFKEQYGCSPKSYKSTSS